MQGECWRGGSWNFITFFATLLRMWSIARFGRGSPYVTCSQVPCRPTWGSKYAAMRKQLELGAAPSLTTLRRVEGRVGASGWD
jgi:hypothetical protein